MKFLDQRIERSLKNIYKHLDLPYVTQFVHNPDKTEKHIYIQVIPCIMNEDKIVMIKVKLKTRERLKGRGKKGDTYDDVVSSMFSELEGEAGDQQQ